MRYPSDIFFYPGAPNQCEKDFNAKKIFQSESALQESFPSRITEILSEFTGIYSKIVWIFWNLTKFNATPDLMDPINQWRAENLFHQNLFLIGPDKSINGQNRNQWNLFQQKSFFISAGRINQSINAELFRAGR